MLHKLFPQLCDHLRAAVPALGTIDLDMAQLDYENQEPIQYPAVYIDLESVAWKDLGAGIQTGPALLRFTVAVEVSEESYEGAAGRPAGAGSVGAPPSCRGASSWARAGWLATPSPTRANAAIITGFMRAKKSETSQCWPVRLQRARPLQKCPAPQNVPRPYFNSFSSRLRLSTRSWPDSKSRGLRM